MNEVVEPASKGECKWLLPFFFLSFLNDARLERDPENDVLQFLKTRRRVFFAVRIFVSNLPIRDFE